MGRLNAARAMVVAAGLCAAFPAPPAALACGFEKPEAVALGMLNWTYPDALHVRTALWQAENAGLLPPRAQQPTAGLLAFHRAAASLRRLGELAGSAGPPPGARSFAVVLVPEVMWTRFVPDATGFTVRPHAPGPDAGDTVVVTGVKAVRALVDGSLDVDTAQAHGLLRFYGAEADSEAVRAMLSRAVRRPQR